jgi:hypothetical protein
VSFIVLLDKTLRGITQLSILYSLPEGDPVDELEGHYWIDRATSAGMNL